MRRILLLLLCCLLLTTAAAAAADSVTDLQSSTIISSDGTCQVTVTMTLHFSQAPEQVLFPLHEDARDITLNGQSIRPRITDGYRYVDFGSIVSGAGTFTITLAYSLPDSIYADEKDQLYLGLDLLCGFAFPIEKMSFDITLPGEVEHDPLFVSTYHQDGVDLIMDLTVSGNRITGVFRETLMDQEALRMDLPVSEQMFPQPMVKRWSLSADDVVMYVCALLAVVYWLIAMRCRPPKRERRTTPPDGLTAGELGCALTNQGVTLTFMLLSWAQMGYLTIQPGQGGRVRLLKCMDMGNERSDFENHFFRTLFGKRNTIDGTGTHYARLCRKAGKHRTHQTELFHPHSGNPMILRLLCIAIGLAGGVSIAFAFANDTFWHWLLGILFAVLSIPMCILIHRATVCLHLWAPGRLPAAVIASLLWLALGALASEVLVALFVVGCQWFGGLAAGYGGRRTALGKATMQQVLGLRRFLHGCTPKELQQIQKQNPEYFFAMAPYALALGVDRAFAKKFGKAPLPPCHWLKTDSDTLMTAESYMALLRTTVYALDERQKHFLWNRIFRK